MSSHTERSRTPRGDDDDEDDRRGWADAQKNLDRQWYSLDEGYDDTNNPFAGTSDEYTQRKEKELEQKKKKKMSERARQIHKVSN